MAAIINAAEPVNAILANIIVHPRLSALGPFIL
jgi:hypothetical protein